MELVVDADEEAGEDEEAVSRAARALVASRRTGRARNTVIVSIATDVYSKRTEGLPEFCWRLPLIIEHNSGTIVLVPANIFFRVEIKKDLCGRVMFVSFGQVRRPNKQATIMRLDGGSTMVSAIFCGD